MTSYKVNAATPKVVAPTQNVDGATVKVIAPIHVVVTSTYNVGASYTDSNGY